MNELTLGYGDKVTYSLEEAQHAIAGYAFATRSLRWSPTPGMTSRGDALRGDDGDREQRRWAYRTYDCLESTPGPWAHW